MRKFTLNIFTLSLGLAVMPMVEAAPTAQQQLLEQVRLGEATHREDLVQQSLYRLELIDPNNPDVVAARFRSLLRQGDIDGAQKQLDRLSQLAPSSNAYKSSPFHAGWSSGTATGTIAGDDRSCRRSCGELQQTVQRCAAGR
ncbi:cellulose synthase [Escherichia coli]